MFSRFVHVSFLSTGTVWRQAELLTLRSHPIMALRFTHHQRNRAAVLASTQEDQDVVQYLGILSVRRQPAAPPARMRQKGPDPMKLVENASQNPAEIARADGVSVLTSHTPVLADEIARAPAGFETKLGVITPIIEDYAIETDSPDPVGIEKQGSADQAVRSPAMIYRDLYVQRKVEVVEA
jgi:hypothetical protein